MGRRKLEMKRIEDKSSRLVTFSKRRAGLIKKARQLSVLCDVDVAVVVFSARGKLYEFCSGGSNSVEHILSRYQKSCLEAEERTIKGAGEDLEFFLQCTRFRTCKELLQTVDRLVGENNAEELSVIDMTQLEEELDAALVQTRSRKDPKTKQILGIGRKAGRMFEVVYLRLPKSSPPIVASTSSLSSFDMWHARLDTVDDGVHINPPGRGKEVKGSEGRNGEAGYISEAEWCRG